MSALAQPIPDAFATLAFAGATLLVLPSGAVYWPARRTLLVADLHFEKLSSFARAGQLLPPYDTGMTLTLLEADIAETGAETLVSLGDSFHRDEGAASLLPDDRARLGVLVSRLDWVWIAGNHDPAPHRLGGRCMASLDLDALHLTHHPRAGRPGLVAGHLHPAARIALNGRATRRPCLVHDGSLMILPAYGAATGSINILGPAFAGLLRRASLEVVMLGRGRAYQIHPRHLVNG